MSQYSVNTTSTVWLLDMRLTRPSHVVTDRGNRLKGQREVNMSRSNINKWNKNEFIDSFLYICFIPPQLLNHNLYIHL